jgi:ubiquitin carboxyl-terminal hydrolase 8|eukprot:Stramenopile-MAST_4_protein_699
MGGCKSLPIERRGGKEEKHTRNSSSLEQITPAGNPELKAKMASVTMQGTASLPKGARAGYIGLQNLGNTCFMNSALQCLSHTQPLTEYFLYCEWRSEINIENPLGMKGKLAESYGALVTKMWRGHSKVLSPNQFKNIVGQWAPQFAGYDQHDSSELLTFLLDGLHEDLNRVTKKPYVEDVECGDRPEELVAAESWRNYLLRNKSIVVDLFQGQLRSKLTCTKCLYSRIKFDPFMYLSVPVPKTHEALTLDDCLREFTAEEDLTKDDQWYCPKCKDFRDAKKKFDLWKVPPVLLVCLKRFEYSEDGRRRKIEREINFPVDQPWSLSDHVKSPQREKPSYTLFAVANHHGGYGGGHYTAYAKHHENNEGWYLYNDKTYKKVKDAQTEVKSADAYVLMYQQMVTVKKGGMYRRQTISLPHLWPHMVGVEESAGRSSIFRPSELKLKKAMSDPSVG